ncbi:MAG: hypothetical protein WA821_14530 [Anaerolineales bacterium]
MPALNGEAPPQKLSEALLSTGDGRLTITACRPEQISLIGDGAKAVGAGGNITVGSSNRVDDLQRKGGRGFLKYGGGQKTAAGQVNCV